MKVVVVIPTYNEAENLEEMANAIFCLPIPDVGILIVDDNSPDGTGNIADSLSERYREKFKVIHREQKLGLGTAYVQGFREAIKWGADIIVEMDADFSHDPKYLPKLIEYIQDNDVVVGSRYVEGGQTDTGWGMSRLMLSRFGNLYSCLLTGVKVKDATSGFKAFRTHVIESMDFESFTCTGFAFQVEMAYMCHKQRFKITEIPVKFTDRRKGISKINHRIIIEALLKIPLMRLRHL